MVKLEEVPDEEFTTEHPNVIDDADDWDTDSDSDIESAVSDPPEETLSERLAALQDIIPPSQRRFLTSTYSSASGWLKSGVLTTGKALWVLSTSALLLGVPWALAYAEEQQMVEMEREMKLQQSANDVLTPSAQTGQQQARTPL
ncbi:mitochondrial import translocase, subunit Tom22, partial [Patellaria atrata CBS 101060]